MKIENSQQVVTDSKLVEEKLAAENRRLIDILSGLNAGLWEWNIQTGETIFNGRWAEMIGYTLEEISPQSIETWKKYTHPDDLKVSVELLEKHFKGESDYYECEARMKHKNGSWIWVLDKGKVHTWDEEGSPLSMSGTHQDITERKQMESTLKESKNRLRDITFSMADWVWEVDENGVYTYTSQKSFDLLGQSRGFVIGRTPFDLMPPDEAKRVAAIFSEIVANKAPIKDLENWNIGKNGERICLLTNGVPILDENGNLKGYRGVDKDITERKQAENLLAQTRKNYEAFFNAIDDFLFILDEEGNIIHANTTVIGRLGYTREELFGKSVLMVHPPDRRDEAGRIVGEMLNGEATFCPVPIITKSGVQIPVETRVSHGFWDGKPAIFGVTKDISQIKLSEEKFSKLFHINPSACGLSDLENHKYIEVNEAFCNLLGFNENEVIGKTAADLGILTAETINAITGKLDSNGKANNIETELLAKNGDIKHVLLSAESIYVQDKKYRYTVVHDITERKQAETKLKQLSARLELATRAGRVGVWDLDIVNNILFWDDQMYKLYGVDKKEFGNAYESWLAGVHPDDVAQGDEEVQTAIREKKDLNTEFRIIWPDGAIRYIRALAIVQRNDSGEPLHMIGTNWDITAQKHAEDALRESKENLLKINAEKDKFFSIIAHDLRSPFNLFLGFTKIMAEKLDTIPLEEIQKMALLMKNAATNLYRLLENLLEWSLLQRGITTFIPVSFLLMPKILENLLALLELARHKKITISYDIPEDLMVFTDENMLGAIVRNLTSNAIKFTPKGGKIFIAAQSLDDNFVEISIKDTGIGMSSEMTKNIFRLDNQTGRRGTEGELSTGLGLIICKEFIEKHGGKIWVESKEGKGSKFSFTFLYRC